MPVKFFVSQDYQQQENPPEYSHEISAVIDIIKNIYAAFNHHPNLYAIVANLDKKNAYADLVVITPRGLGVIELKGYPGPIRQQGSVWYAGQTVIKAGSDRTPAKNPHEQVQAYAQEIRNMLTKNIKWLPGTVADRQGLKFSTAVCFTHDKAEVDTFRKTYRQWDYEKPWEQFKILKVAEIAEWAMALSFEAKNQYESYRLNSSQIMQIVRERDFFRATEWTEIKNLMPTGEPYAYLRQGNLIMPLVADEVTLGKEAESCAVVIPKEFKRVSRLHAKITRRVDGVFMEDLGSTNGTYLNNKPLNQATELQGGDTLSLGGLLGKPGTCLLEFFFEPPSSMSMTEIGTQF